MQKLNPWGFIGMGVLACDLFLYVALPLSVHVAWWLVMLMLLIWLTLLVLAARSFSARPMRTFWISVVGAVLWFGEIALAAATR